MKTYVMVGWPEIQLVMEHPRWSECRFCIETNTSPCPDSTYAVPVDIYKEVFKLPKSLRKKAEFSVRDYLPNTLISHFKAPYLDDLYNLE